jgi:hypothetical protein
MHARVAYISSLGTTAILVTAAVLMLAVVGTIVAFRGWPASANDSGVQSVPLAPHSTPARAALVRRTATLRGVTRTAFARAAARRVSTAGLVKQAPAGPSVVPDLVMVPVAAAPMHPTASHPGGPGNPPPAQPGSPDPAARAGPPLPDPGEGGPLPDPGGPLTVLAPAPGPGGLPSSTDELSAIVGQLLESAPPPPR